MAEIVNIGDYQAPDFIELPIIKPHDLPVIESMKEKVGVIVGRAFIEEIIGIAGKGKNILTEKNIASDSLPYNIKVHLKQVKETEKQELVAKINNAMKGKINVKIKKQLLHLRNKILQNNIQN